MGFGHIFSPRLLFRECALVYAILEQESVRRRGRIILRFEVVAAADEAAEEARVADESAPTLGDGAASDCGAEIRETDEYFEEHVVVFAD